MGAIRRLKCLCGVGQYEKRALTVKRVEQALATLVVALIAISANAASLSFVYTGDNDVDSDGTVVAAVNDLLTFDIVMDFTDDPTIGGGYSVSFTAETLRFGGRSGCQNLDPVGG